MNIMPIIQIAIGLLVAIGCISIAAHLKQKLREDAAYNALQRYEAKKAREADAIAAMQELDELEKELSEKSRE